MARTTKDNKRKSAVVHEEAAVVQDDDDDFKPVVKTVKKPRATRSATAAQLAKDEKQQKITVHLATKAPSPVSSPTKSSPTKNVLVDRAVVAATGKQDDEQQQQQNKPLHPFFQAVARKKEMVEKKEENQRVLEERLKHGGKIPDMFKTKKEKDEEYVEMIQNQFRQDIIKSSVDHATISAGKPVHPFFAEQQQMLASAAVKDTVVDVDALSTVQKRLYTLVDWPVDKDVEHAGWMTVGDDTNNTMLRERLRLSQEYCSSGFIVEPDTLINGFSRMFDEPEPRNFTPPSLDVASESIVEQEFLDRLHAVLMAVGHPPTFTLVHLAERYHAFLASLATDARTSSLWSDRYQTSRSLVDTEAYGRFKEWIAYWSAHDSKRYKPPTPAKRGGRRKSSTASDLGPTDLHSAIAVVGPSGCGKTSMVYTAGRQYTYHILESNASSRRSGRQITEMFGEATQSKNLVSSISDRPKTNETGATLILFEEIDILFDDDKGFLSSLGSLISSSKIPIVLICNERLFEANDIEALHVQHCDSLTLLTLLYFILMAENRASAFLNEAGGKDLLCFIDRHNNDMRRCVNNLQLYVAGSTPLASYSINLYHQHHLLQKHQGLFNLLLPNHANTQDQLQLATNVHEHNDIYFNNYLSMFTTSSSTPSPSTPSKSDQLEDLWKVSHDLSLNDIISFEFEPTISYVNTLANTVMDNSLITYSSMLIDYQPFLSDICRSESQRRLNNPKRGNRFNHYLDFTEKQCEALLAHNLL
eukprot:gene12641-14849_t